MASLAEISDEPKFTIKDVSRKTGILPVTLRAWERRYQIVIPRRSDNSYRLYSERDIAVLGWVQSRLDQGLAISSAADELRALQSAGTLPLPPPVISPTHSLFNTGQYVHKLYAAFIRHDELEASRLLRESYASFDLQIYLLEIITPCLHQIGDAWYQGKIQVVTEHFASAYLRGQLISILQAQPFNRSALRILLGCAPTEQHEIGTLILAILLRHSGLRVEFLGPDVPIDDLVEYAGQEHARLIVLSATMPDSVQGMEHIQEKLNRLSRPPLFGYGGLAFDLDPKIRERVPGVYLGSTLDQALSTIRRLLGSAPARGKTFPNN